MSSFKIKAKHKQSSEIHEVLCIDDYFGKHQYGYCPNIEGGDFLTLNQFNAKYEVDDDQN